MKNRMKNVQQNIHVISNIQYTATGLAVYFTFNKGLNLIERLRWSFYSEIVNNSHSLTIFAKSSISDVRQGS